MLIGPQNSSLHVNHVRSRILRAAAAAGRDPAAVTLVAVTKAQTAETVRVAATAGVTDFGENYLKEALAKMDRLADLELRWHYIGGIQSNKTRAIAERFDWVHSIDRFSVARRLSEQRPFHAPPLNMCIQVELVPEPNKGGVEPGAVGRLAAAAAELPRVRLRGLMCIPPPQPDAAAERATFARLRLLLEELNASGHKLDTLSMGMSADFESAIAEGATLVRIGTALFGPRGAGGSGTNIGEGRDEQHT
ncbi:MAG TPA: YggS family pyridoxal phosphate-dependent enzyme [Steroidobacteraceae bacterium]|jgi:pyridoxal phosphate enzyme (YggS family)|nr:YggS family pyridoxal phosphate-dependent enzyme [Steroidobacteraceae bacterium]